MSVVVEVDYFNARKQGQKISGDVFLLNRDSDRKRIVCTLSDGLGSGVKANVLASLTANMGQKFALNGVDIRRTAQKIMVTLPVCSERHISYSTFTIVDVSTEGSVKVINYDNPDLLFFSGESQIKPEQKKIELEKRIGDREEHISYATFTMQYGDRLLFFSDGVTQSGMGTAAFPLGWRMPELTQFVAKSIKENSQISARELTRSVVRQGIANDCFAPKDDITCAAVYFRKPRNTLVVTGAPMHQKQDAYLAQQLEEFEGARVISGGTTATIVARELNREVSVDLSHYDKVIPPQSTMEGMDLVSEGMITLSKVVKLLEHKDSEQSGRKNAATKMVELLLNSDRVHFIVGTRINEAHQNPDMPVEIGIRRTIVQKIRTALEEIYLKETTLEYL